MITATEVQEQEALMEYCQRFAQRVPALALLFHIPNGEKREPSTAARLKRMGVKPGIPDLFLPVPMQGSHGLWIELKRMGGKPTAIQEAWHGALRQQGYAVVVAAGWHNAAAAILSYLEVDLEAGGF